MSVPFTEATTTEQMIIDVAKKNGWKYVSDIEILDNYHRNFGDVMVESMVKEALIRLNPIIAEHPERADEVIYRLRAVINSVQPQDLVAQNELFKRIVFEENSYPFGPNGKSVSIRFFGSAVSGDLEKNEYVVTNQWVYPQKEGGKRFDLVFLINGFPMIIGEVKTPVRAAITWLDGAQDIDDYEQAVPQMFVTNIFNFATEGKCFRYGSVKMPIEKWGPWRTPENHEEGLLKNVMESVESMITPEKAVDIFQFFTLFNTDSHYRKFKIVCRYQQYEGANMIVDRVRHGYPKKGLIWHFQGSGKTYLMVFAAQKLRMLPELHNPTIVIVDDRIDLESDMNGYFDATNIPNAVDCSSKDDLIDFFHSDTRKILITTIYKFGEVTETLNTRDNIIVMVDEAHRTQEGNLGMKMRKALPNAFFFGLTGTPINKLEHNTFVTFGAAEDEGGYMSKYSIEDSLNDKETLPITFLPGPVEYKINKEKLNEEFDELTDDLSDIEKAELSDHVGMEAIMNEPNRVHKIAEHIVNHYNTNVEPNGFKAQIVCYNRAACLLYKAELDKMLPEQESTVVIDTNNDKADKYKKYRRSRDELKKLLDRYRNPDDPLKFLIVTSKLLTGFDAPILQCQYLDKPMKDHTLLQAICRVNRPYPGKSFGLIVDYIGLFDDVAKSLDFDDDNMKKIVTNIKDVKTKFPNLIKKCLRYFPNVDRTKDGWEGLLLAQNCLPNNETKDQFAADFQVLNRAWNALSPDPFLNSYESDYKWLCKVFESVKPVSPVGRLLWTELGPKTMELIHNNMEVGEVKEEAALTLDAELLETLLSKGGDGGDKTAKKVEIDLIALIHKHSNNPKYIQLGEKLESLKDRQEQGLINSIEFLKGLLDLSKEAVQAEKEVVPVDEQNKGKAALTELFNGVKNQKTPVIVERIVNDIDAIVKVVRFDHWQNTTEGKREIKKALRSIIWIKYKIKDNDVFNKAYEYIAQYY